MHQWIFLSFIIELVLILINNNNNKSNQVTHLPHENWQMILLIIIKLFFQVNVFNF